MNSRAKMILILVTLVVLTLACSLSPQPPEVNQDEVATLVEATISAQQTLNVSPEETQQPPPTSTPDPNNILAPDPLPAQFTGLIFEAGTCYDFDTFLPVADGDPARDICMLQFGMLEPQNGGLMSGHAPMEPPSKGYCINPNLLPDPIAVQTDLYLCFQTNLGTYGFFVAREYQINLDRVIFDMYLFP